MIDSEMNNDMVEKDIDDVEKIKPINNQIDHDEESMQDQNTHEKAKEIGNLEDQLDNEPHPPENKLESQQELQKETSPDTLQATLQQPPHEAQSQATLQQEREENSTNQQLTNDYEKPVENTEIHRPLKRAFNPDSISYETTKRKIPSYQINKYWDYLDPTTLSSLIKIVDIGIIKSLDRISNPKKLKIAEKYLLKSWISDDPRSFQSRLIFTNLPKISSMHQTNAKNDENNDILNYDHLNHRKKWLETYLSAELKQLDELNKYYERLHDGFEADQLYYKQLEKTIALNKSKMSREKASKLTQLSGNQHKPDTNHQIIPNYSAMDMLDNNDDFTINDDDELLSLLNDVNNNLDNLSKKSIGLKQVNDALQSFQNNLDLMD